MLWDRTRPRWYVREDRGQPRLSPGTIAQVEVIVKVPLTESDFAQSVGTDRWTRYKQACSNDVGTAAQLYRWNARVSAALMEILGHTEVILRNALHLSLAQGHATLGLPGEWYDRTDLLTQRSQDDIAIVKSRLQAAGKPLTAGRVVAGLDFGFWRFLLTRNHHFDLWVPYLRTAFPCSSGRRTDVFDCVDRLSRLRNRCAHHEEVFDRTLADDERLCADLVGWIQPDLRTWLTNVSRIPVVAAKDPRALVVGTGIGIGGATSQTAYRGLPEQ